MGEIGHSSNALKQSFQGYGVQKVISDLLFSVFPNDSFKEHLTLFKKAITQPINLREFIFELGKQIGLGATSHVAIVARELLSLPNFPMFTRDYIKRCCDLVELATKLQLASQLHIDVGHKPLGGVVKILHDSRYGNLVPKNLIHNLDSFNRKIYCPAKHEVLEDEGKHMYSVSDAIAVTFISMKLCQQIQDLCYEIQRGKRF